MRADDSSLAGFRSPWERNAAWLLLLVAVALRCALPQWIDFRGDERTALLGTREFLEQGQWRHGLTASTGLVTGPFFFYLLAPIVALTHDPVLVTGWVMLLNLVALAALGLLLQRGFGLRCAVLGTALFAALPIGSMFARKLWSPDLLLPLVLPLFAIILRLARAYSRGWLLTGTALFGIAVQVHPCVWFLAPGILLACWLLPLRPPLRDLGWAACVLFACFVPWLSFEFSTDFDDIRSYLHLREGGSAFVPGFWSRLAQHWGRDFGLTSGTELPAFLGPVRTQLLQGSPLLALAPALYAACFLACVWCIARAIRRARSGPPRGAGERLLLLCACVFLTASPAYALLGALPEFHYHILMIPIVSLFLVVALADLLHGARARWLTPLLGVLALSQLALEVEVRRVSLVAGGEGLYQPLGAADMQKLRDKLPVELDAELARPRLFEEAQRALARRFESSHTRLWQLDPAQEPSLASGTGGVELAPSSSGLLVRGSTFKDMLRLPEFAPAAAGRALLRLELSVPVPQHLVLFYSLPGSVEPLRKRVVAQWIPAGRSTLHVELPDAQACGPLYLRLPAYRYVVHAAEVRALEP